jgi:hypothetical protein
MIADWPSQERGVAHSPVYGVGLFVGHTLRLRGHVFGVLACLSLVGKIHIYGLRGVAEDLVELEGLGTHHSTRRLLSDPLP